MATVVDISVLGVIPYAARTVYRYGLTRFKPESNATKSGNVICGR